MNFDKSAFENKKDKNLPEAPPVGNVPEVSIDHLNLKDFDEEKSMIEKLVDLKGDNNWEDVRSDSNFDLVEKEYSFGKRKVYVPRKVQNNIKLQSSRGTHIANDETIEKTLKRFVQYETVLDEPDSLRIQELSTIRQQVSENLEDFLKESTNQEVIDAVTKAMTNPQTKFVEVGFRVPSLMNYWSKNGFDSVSGYDINPLNIAVCKKLGWDVHSGDLNTGEGFDFSGVGLVVAYHVLEHVYDPFESLKILNKLMDPGTMFHIEVPIEPGVPRLKYGHLFPFESGDLQHMLIDAGFIPISYSNIPHSGGPAIERILAVSK